MTPFPSKAPLRFIIGAPIPVPENPLGEKVIRHKPDIHSDNHQRNLTDQANRICFESFKSEPQRIM